MFKLRLDLGAALALIALVAFFLRIFRLDQQSLWYDEAFSVFLARLDLGAIAARTAADIQPPLYYYLLHFWIALAGDVEFAVRFLSLWFGVLTVPLLYVVARRLFNRAAGVFAALLACVSPLYLWYSQETRMYTLITFLGLLSSYFLLKGLAGNRESKEPAGTRRKWWVAFALTNIAAVYTHYFAFVIIAFQFVYALWVIIAKRGLDPSRFTLHVTRSTQHSARNALFSFAAILVAFLPWLPFVLNRLGEDASYWRGALKLDEAIRHIFIVFATGESVLEAIAQNIAAAWLLVLLAGLFAWLLARKKEKTPTTQPLNYRTIELSNYSTAFAILYLLIPLALLLLLFSRNPKFNARYLMIASPGLVLLLGAGLASLWALARSGKIFARLLAGFALLAVCALLFGTALYADDNAYSDPAFTKPDFRGVARHITANARNDEAIILVSGHIFAAFDYYYTAAALPELRLPDEPTLNAEHVLNFSAANELNRALAGAGRRGAWLVQWQNEVVDPNDFTPMLLSTRGAEEKLGAAFWHVKLRHWTFPENFKPFAAQPEMASPREANFKNDFKLLGWSAAQPTSADKGATFTLYWQALDTTTDDYNVALRVVDAQGSFWGKLDRRPSGYNYPTPRWKKGETLFGEYTVPLLPGTPAGDYYATVTLFTKSDQTGLDVLATNGAPLGKSVRVGPIRVLPAETQPSFVDLKIQHTLSASAAPFTLLGYAVGREKASTGESIPFTIFWRADEKPTADYSFQILFGDKASAALPLANAAYPTSQWRAGEIVRGQHSVQIPSDASAGDLDLQVKLSGARAANAVVDLMQPFTIEKTDRVFVKPDAQFAQDATFGNNVIALVGYDLSATEIKAGDPSTGSGLTVTLNWKALGKLDKPYTIFVHLLDKDSKVVAQKDAQPLNGARPTQTWVEGEYLRDAFALALKPDTPPGEYRLEIGWYDAGDPSFARLQVIDANGNGAGDNVILNKSVLVK